MERTHVMHAHRPPLKISNGIIIIKPTNGEENTRTPSYMLRVAGCKVGGAAATAAAAEQSKLKRKMDTEQNGKEEKNTRKKTENNNTTQTNGKERKYRANERRGEEVAGGKKYFLLLVYFWCFHLFRLKQNDEVSLHLLRLLRSHIKLELKLGRSTLVLPKIWRTHKQQ